MSRRATTHRQPRSRSKTGTSALLALMVAGLVPLAGCGDESSPGPGSGSDDQAGAAAVPSTIPVVDQDGLRALLEGKRGTPLLLNFWATWCGPCVAELPDLQKVARAHAADGLEVIALALELMVPRSTVENSLAQLPGFLEDKQLDLPVVLYSGEDVGPLADWLGVSMSLPVTLVIGADGRIIGTHEGSATEEEFHELAEQALGAPVEGR